MSGTRLTFAEQRELQKQPAQLHWSVRARVRYTPKLEGIHVAAEEAEVEYLVEAETIGAAMAKATVDISEAHKDDEDAAIVELTARLLPTVLR